MSTTFWKRPRCLSLSVFSKNERRSDVHILGAACYGVPQMRWRTIIIGLRGKIVPAYAFPEPVRHAPIRPNFTTAFDGRPLVKTPSAETAAPFTTVREAVRILSFPGHFIFTGTMAGQFAQVGNAEPPLLAESVGLSIRNVLQEAR